MKGWRLTLLVIAVLVLGGLVAARLFNRPPARAERPVPIQPEGTVVEAPPPVFVIINEANNAVLTQMTRTVSVGDEWITSDGSRFLIYRVRRIEGNKAFAALDRTEPLPRIPEEPPKGSQ